MGVRDWSNGVSWTVGIVTFVVVNAVRVSFARYSSRTTSGLPEYSVSFSGLGGSHLSSGWSRRASPHHRGGRRPAHEDSGVAA